MKIRVFFVFIIFKFNLVYSGILGSFTPMRYDSDEQKDFSAWPHCEGRQASDNINVRIVGGVKLRSLSSTPYIAAVGEDTGGGNVTWYCGGSLISANLVITAAHCVAKSRSADFVRLGELTLTRTVSSNDYRVSQVVTHPEYTAPVTYHDVALLKLGKTVVLTNHIQPICLPRDNRSDFTGELATVAGWGTDNVGGEASEDLHSVEVRIFSNNECNKTYSNSTVASHNFPVGVIGGQLCAGSRNGGKDACKGDSGGPLVTTDSSGSKILVGVVSSGTGCGVKSFPGVYVRVSYYLDWIKNYL